MASALKLWRQNRREATYWAKARERSSKMRTVELIENIELALMSGGQAITRWRQSPGPAEAEIQLMELRMQLEAALGMLDNIL